MFECYYTFDSPLIKDKGECKRLADLRDKVHSVYMFLADELNPRRQYFHPVFLDGRMVGLFLCCKERTTFHRAGTIAGKIFSGSFNVIDFAKAKLPRSVRTKNRML